MQDSSNKEFTPDKIIQYSNYKEPTINPNEEYNPEEYNPDKYNSYEELNDNNESMNTSNASKEEYSVISLALMLSNERNIKDLISRVKNELHANIEISRDVLKVHINDNKTNKKEEINVPLDIKFKDDANDTSKTNKTYNLTLTNES